MNNIFLSALTRNGCHKSMHVPRGFIVLFASTLAAIVNEMIAWGLVFRTDHYKRLKQNLLQAEKRLEVCDAVLRCSPRYG